MSMLPTHGAVGPVLSEEMCMLRVNTTFLLLSPSLGRGWIFMKANTSQLADQVFPELALIVASAADNDSRVCIHPGTYEFEGVDSANLKKVVKYHFGELFTF